jgi:hypothetical protein
LFWSSGWDSAESSGARALPTPPTLVGLLGSAREDLRRHNTCAPATMAGLATRPMAMGDGTARERATQGARARGGTGDWGKGTRSRPLSADGRRGLTDEQPRCFGAEQISI